MIYAMFFVSITSAGTGAYFTDSAVSTNNTFTTAENFGDEPSTPSGALVINEVSPQGGNSTDWIEIFNGTTSEINLTGWTITDNDSSDTLPTISGLPAGEYAVIVASGSSVAVPVDALQIVLSTPTIGNGLAEAGDKVILKDLSSSVIDQMSYGTNSDVFSGIPSPISVQTLRRIPNGIDTNTSTDWAAGSPSIGTINL